MITAHPASRYPEAIDATRITQASTDVFFINVRGLTLNSGRHAIAFANLSLPEGKRPLSAILPGSREDARFEIGEIQIENGEATLVIFGPPTFQPDTLVI